MEKHDSILRKQLMDHYNTPIGNVDCITSPHLQLVINAVREFDKKHTPDRVDLYETLLREHGECSFMFKGSLIKIRESTESTGYSYKCYTEDNDDEHYFQFHEGSINTPPIEAIKYVMELL